MGRGILKAVGTAAILISILGGIVIVASLLKRSNDRGEFLAITGWFESFGFPENIPQRKFESRNFRTKKFREPDFHFTPRAGFKAFLSAALRYDAVSAPKDDNQSNIDSEPASAKHASQTGTRFVSVRYARPPLKLRSLHRRARKPVKKLLVILPGLGSSAAKVLGDDNIDYHNELGITATRMEFDVLVPDLVSDIGMVAAINIRLTMMGYQIDGLQARQTCDTTKWLVERFGYREVYLYGIQNGARLADMVAVLCPEPFKRVVLDDPPLPYKRRVWRAAAWNELEYTAQFQYFGPLFADSSFVDFMLDRKVAKTYLLRRDVLDAVLPILTRHAVLTESASPISSRVVLTSRSTLGMLADHETLFAILSDPNPKRPSFALKEK